MRIAQHSTAVNAFHNHTETGKAHAQRTRILEFIKERGGDWSIGEIANTLKLEKSTVSARINELLHETFELVAKRHRKDRISGITIRPVGLPTAQLDMFQ